jgi:hypothetical protein
MKYSLLCLNSNIYTNRHHVHTMVLMYLVDCTYIQSTVIQLTSGIFLYKHLDTHQILIVRLGSELVVVPIVPLQLTMPRLPTRSKELLSLDLKAVL